MNEIAVAPAANYIPRPGWSIWTGGPLGVDHLVDPQGRCHSCGDTHPATA